MAGGWQILTVLEIHVGHFIVGTLSNSNRKHEAIYNQYLNICSLNCVELCTFFTLKITNKLLNKNAQYNNASCSLNKPFLIKTNALHLCLKNKLINFTSQLTMLI